jgi:ATP-binding cassette subfamily B protein
MVLKSIILKLWPHINKKLKIRVILLIIFSVFATFAEMLSVAALVPFLSIITQPEILFANKFLEPGIEYFQYSAPEELIEPIFYSFVILISTSAVFRFCLLWLETSLSSAIGIELKSKAYKLTLYQSYSTHLNRNSSVVIATITEKIRALVVSVIQPLLTIISSTIIMLGLVIVVFFISPELILIILSIFIPMFFVAAKLSKKHLLVNGKIISNNQDRVVRTLQESLSGIREVIMFSGAYENFIGKFNNSSAALENANKINIIIAGSPRFLIETIGIIIFSVFAVKFAPSENIIPMLGGLALAAQKMMPYLQKIYQSVSQIRSGSQFLADVLNLLEQSPHRKESVHSEEKINFSEYFELKNVFFKYSRDDDWLLSDFSLRINHGDQIGIIGKTGSGKSSLIDLLFGLLEPDQGFLCVDNVNIISDSQKLGWLKNISHIPQKIFLTDSDIWSNVAYGVPQDEINYKKVITCSKIACIYDSISTWPKGFNTIVGEKGIGLSGGEQQRIGIARALYFETDILVLDEATSALDVTTEKLIMQNISKMSKTKTIIIITHKTEILVNCHRVVELSKSGSINELGHYEKFINSSH